MISDKSIECVDFHENASCVQGTNFFDSPSVVCRILSYLSTAFSADTTSDAPTTRRRRPPTGWIPQIGKSIQKPLAEPFARPDVRGRRGVILLGKRQRARERSSRG